MIAEEIVGTIEIEGFVLFFNILFCGSSVCVLSAFLFFMFVLMLSTEDKDKDFFDFVLKKPIFLLTGCSAHCNEEIIVVDSSVINNRWNIFDIFLFSINKYALKYSTLKFLLQ